MVPRMEMPLRRSLSLTLGCLPKTGKGHELRQNAKIRDGAADGDAASQESESDS